MPSRSLSLLAATSMLLMLLLPRPGGLAAAPAPAPLQRPSENIALHKPYTLTPAPNYSYCTDPGDARQLTDGEYSKGYFWTQRGTVGWNGKAKPVIIRIDLGQVEPIRGVSFNTAAGKAGAHWPQAIYLLASDDGKQFYSAGELIALSLKQHSQPPQGYAVHRYWTDALQTHGRYLSLLVMATDYTFVDEIEVYRGASAWTSKPLAGEAFPGEKDAFKSISVLGGIRRRLQADAGDVRELLAASSLAPSTQAALGVVLADLERQVQELGLPANPATFRTVFPLNELHEQLFLLQSRVWARDAELRGESPDLLPAWPANPWDPQPLIHALPSQNNTSLSLAMMNNEYRALSFNLGNINPVGMKLSLQVAGLPGGLNPGWITVHEVQWTDTATSTPVAAALPLAERTGDHYLVSIPSGLPRQLWLTFHPRDLPPGEYHGFIRIQECLGAGIPLTVRISPVRFPDRPTLHLGGWDYTSRGGRYGYSDATRDKLIAHLREHYVDSPWGASVMPRGQFDAAGNMTVPPDTADFDAWLKLWPAARRYCVTIGVEGGLNGLAMGSPAFERAVQAWIRFWAAHAQKRGLKPEQLVVLIMDEPRNPEMDKVLHAWLKPLRAANTGIRFWEDPTHSNPFAADQAMLALCDILCPNRTMMYLHPQYGEYYARHRPAGGELEFYSCSGPGRLLDPYAYYRLQAWECWRHGATAEYFWAFGESVANGNSSWNEYAMTRDSYVPFFLDASSVTPGKQMEAIREGVEDYEYLVMLRDAVARAEKAGRHDAALAKARRLLAAAASRVLDAPGASSFHWCDAKDRSLADQVRLEILAALESL